VQRPVIGLAVQTLEAGPGRQPPCWSVGQCYVRTLAAAGGLPWLVPLLPDEAVLRAVYDRLDGVLLAGGADLDPAAYGEERHPLCDRPDPARDRTELALARWAAAEGKPLLGVCRGIQALNVALGGSLHQHLAERHGGAIKHDYFSSGGEYARDYRPHAVRVAPGSRLGRVLGAEEVPVNSMHHQGIRRLAPGLRATAFAPDGLIEGVEGEGGRYLVGVQWHPEELAEADPVMMRLFRDFVEAAARQAP
jgi:putative glutamine amidotransferase